MHCLTFAGSSLKFPLQKEVLATNKTFEGLTLFSNMVGAKDGSHIKIKTPTDSAKMCTDSHGVFERREECFRNCKPSNRRQPSIQNYTSYNRRNCNNPKNNGVLDLLLISIIPILKNNGSPEEVHPFKVPVTCYNPKTGQTFLNVKPGH